MKIIIGFILALSVSFACDKPYAEVQGIKIGCPLENSQALTVIKQKDGNGITIYEKNMDGMFDTATLLVVNGNIEAVIFKRTREFDPSLFDEVFLRLYDQWDGKILNPNSPALPNILSLQIQDDVLNNIILGKTEDDAPESLLMLGYYSHIMNNLKK